MGTSENGAAVLSASLFVFLQESSQLSPPSWHIGLPVHGYHINQVENIISKTCNWPPVQSLELSFLLLHARAQTGGLRVLLQEKQKRPHPLFEMNPN